MTKPHGPITIQVLASGRYLAVVEEPARLEVEGATQKEALHKLMKAMHDDPNFPSVTETPHPQ